MWEKGVILFLLSSKTIRELKSTPEYKFAIGWYEGGGGEYMQVKLGQGSPLIIIPFN